ncbi:iron ABC transporter permease [Synechococcus sp. RedBA-s]|uniref:ABC transporter permease n=1 Tax=Synechococcus sp. RedBA-s TaxID=2823741 RepID=UPI0020CE3B6F|nr:iron ABC transporter permease [Synechococcus sp. RedBA-s]MCP9799428.1 iron ABC transporter permease [Synechococcus sp. RedBA-s]
MTLLASTPLNRVSRSQRPALTAVVVVIGVLALLPLAALLRDAALQPAAVGGLGLGVDGAEQIRGTLLLVLGEGVCGAVVGTTIGWLTAACRFPGRRWLRIAQLLPLAFPAYLLAASLIDWGSSHSLRIHGLGWAVLLLSLANYSYVFLLSTESFSITGGQLLEASCSLGVGPWQAFRRVALPIALPAIGAGVALSAMEVVNELGAVRLLGVPSLSAGILDRWQVEGDPRGAALLSLMALAIVLVLVAAERSLRRRSRRWTLGHANAEAQAYVLSGWRALLAQLISALPPLLALAIPLVWVAEGWRNLLEEPLMEQLVLAGRSLGLALVATLLTALAALLLSIIRRWSPRLAVRQLSFVAGMGYAVPGSVMALGLMLLGGPWALSPLLLLIWGYGVRFMAVSKQGLDAGLERIPPSIDESATSLGCSWTEVLWRVHLPLLRGPVLVGGLMVFVDVVKELPLTLSLRPFDFDTLAVRVFQYASDERVGAAMAPALVIMALGLVASLALIPTLESRD